MRSDPADNPPAYSPSQAIAPTLRRSDVKGILWTIAITTGVLAVICGLVFLTVWPAASDQFFCSVGSSTACSNWKQTTFIHALAMFGGLLSVGIASLTALVAIILTLTGEA